MSGRVVVAGVGMIAFSRLVSGFDPAMQVVTAASNRKQTCI